MAFSDNIVKAWEKLKESLAEDILDPNKYTEEEIDELIREAGGDPKAIDRRSRIQARKLWAKWQKKSRRKE
ncbi:hypothetical protein HY406_00510 [Candidatus Giovannonibacteria bacterium]|nr:hypothetical protein [Candidatus Giovannonibacteria bacterium]